MRRSPAADVDDGAPLGVWLGLPQDLVGYGGGVSLPEQHVAEQVHDGVALCPAEVAVGLFASLVAQVQQQGGDGVWNDRAFSPQDVMIADFYASHLQHVLEFRRVCYVYLQKQDWFPRTDAVVLALLSQLSGVLLGVVAGPAPVGD